ncbi:MAG: cyclic nucleotide-binding domain-containing protein [Gammaproteobacteria bacterium]|nr:MAG: cyclic nucleotide-binding domain-containing protein [Gammaproteobacteria bacterium]
MPSSIPSYLSCTRCTFAPFCLTEEHRAAKQFRTLERNETLCLPKNKFQNLYVVQHGALKTYQTEADGKELIRGFYFANEILGYEAIYTGHYLFSAVALAETLVCEIPYNHFLESLQSKPALQKRILYLISRQLNVGSYLLSTTAEQRLAAFLIDLSVRLHPLEMKLEFLLPMSRQDIGNYLGLTAETISRIFSRLQKNNIVSIDHKKIHLLQPEKLKQMVDGLISH